VVPAEERVAAEAVVAVQAELVVAPAELVQEERVAVESGLEPAVLGLAEEWAVGPASGRVPGLRRGRDRMLPWVLDPTLPMAMPEWGSRVR
jgi:hypothetical protein